VSVSACSGFVPGVGSQRPSRDPCACSLQVSDHRLVARRLLAGRLAGERRPQVGEGDRLGEAVQRLDDNGCVA